jgi:predicted nucleic acid-binding protein
MPAVVVDSSVLITLAAGEQFHLLRELYTTLYVPPEVWNEVTTASKPFGTNETQQARDAGWLMVRTPASLATVRALPFNLQPGEIEALALAMELADALLLVDDAQGRRAARALGIDYTGTLGVLLRAKAEGKLAALSPALALMQQRTTFWLSEEVHRAALAQAGEAKNSA